VYLPVPFTSTPPVSLQRAAVARLEAAGYRAAWVNETVGGKDPLTGAPLTGMVFISRLLWKT
jgi:hypothetical protein